MILGRTTRKYRLQREGMEFEEGDKDRSAVPQDVPLLKHSLVSKEGDTCDRGLPAVSPSLVPLL